MHFAIPKRSFDYVIQGKSPYSRYRAAYPTSTRQGEPSDCQWLLPHLDEKAFVGATILSLHAKTYQRFRKSLLFSKDVVRCITGSITVQNLHSVGSTKNIFYDGPL